VTNAIGDFVARFPAADPTKVERFKTGFSGSGLGIDSQGNVWVTNRFGNSARGATVLEDLVKIAKEGGNPDPVLTRAMSKQQGGPDGGSVTLLQPDGSQYPGSPFTGGGLPGPWAATVDGNDNVWISNFAMPNSPITQLCGTRTENCPPGMKTGDRAGMWQTFTRRLPFVRQWQLIELVPPGPNPVDPQPRVPIGCRLPRKRGRYSMPIHIGGKLPGQRSTLAARVSLANCSPVACPGLAFPVSSGVRA
jgi:hypothetical protein